MIIESLRYVRYEGKPYEWGIEDKNGNPADFQNINLFVGKNAVGKSRTLAVICDIARLLSERKKITQIKYPNVKYQIALKEDSTRYEYTITIEDFTITSEILSVNGIEKINREKNSIFSEKAKGNIPLDLSDNEFITSLHANQEDFPYIAEIYEWSNALRYYTFTNQIEKNTLLVSEDEFDNLLLAKGLDPDNIISLFSKGKQDFGAGFIQAIIADMNQIGYSISEVDLLKNKRGIGISVQEEELPTPTLQVDMSQGMFRALSFIIQLNYSLMSKMSVCLLIDDLGEGLDFARSKSLIDILIHKINNSYLQIFITTNDRYIMNKIPLKYWTIIERLPKYSLFYNYVNSKDIFDDYKYTGLNNFDFLATDFYLHGFENQEEE